MPVTRGATVSNRKITENATDANHAHTVDASTTLLLILVTYRGNESLNGAPNWNTTEDFTLIHKTTGHIDSSDMVAEFWGLVSPTVKTDTVAIDFLTATNPAFACSLNYLGTEAASVAAATNFLSQDVNLSGTSQAVHASGGSAGNALIMGGAANGQDMTPATQSVGDSFTEIFDTETGPSNTADQGIWVGELLSLVPSAITLDWVTSDENSTILIELVAAAAASSIPVIQRHRMNIGVR